MKFLTSKAIAVTLLAVVAGHAARIGPGPACNILEFGAVPDGRTNNAGSIQKAIDSCQARAAVGEQFVVNIPSGTFLTGTITLVSNMMLKLDKGAVLAGSDNPSAYPLVPPLPSYGFCRDVAKDIFHCHGPLISGSNLTSVVIEGSGMEEDDALIDGQGALWWQRFYDGTLQYARPQIIQITFSRDIVIHKLRISDPPAWNVHLYASENILVEYLRISAPVLLAPNTDGIDLDSVVNVSVRYSDIATGDDAVVIKSGLDKAGVNFGRPSRDIHIYGLWARSKGIAVGSEIGGGVSNVLVEDILLGDSSKGVSWPALNVKTQPGRGGFVENVTFRNCRAVPSASWPSSSPVLAVNMNYADNNSFDDRYPPAPALPVFRNISFENITISSAKQVGEVSGLEHSHATMISFINVAAKDYETGIRCWKATDVTIIGSQLPIEGCEPEVRAGSSRANLPRKKAAAAERFLAPV